MVTKWNLNISVSVGEEVYAWFDGGFVCVEVLQPRQPIRVMSSTVNTTLFFLSRLSPLGC